MNVLLKAQEMQIIQRAIQNAFHLLTEEYESLCNEELKEKYDATLNDLKNANGLVKKHRVNI